MRFPFLHAISLQILSKLDHKRRRRLRAGGRGGGGGGGGGAGCDGGGVAMCRRMCRCCARMRGATLCTRTGQWRVYESTRTCHSVTASDARRHSGTAAAAAAAMRASASLSPSVGYANRSIALHALAAATDKAAAWVGVRAPRLSPSVPRAAPSRALHSGPRMGRAMSRNWQQPRFHPSCNHPALTPQQQRSSGLRLAERAGSVWVFLFFFSFVLFFFSSRWPTRPFLRRTCVTRVDAGRSR